MIRLDLKKEDFDSLKDLILNSAGKPLSKNVTVQEEPGKFEIYFDNDQEARAFEEIAIQSNVAILKKRAF